MRYVPADERTSGARVARGLTRVDPATGHRITSFHRKGHFVRDLMPPARMIKEVKGENQ